MTAIEIERIEQVQQRSRLSFADASVAARITHRKDRDNLAAIEAGYPCLLRGRSELSSELVTAYQPFGAAAEALRALRSQLNTLWFADHRLLAIVSAERSEGRSYIAANLAIAFVQLGLRTLLIDADLRNPRQHRIFAQSNETGLSTLLAGTPTSSLSRRIPLLPGLYLVPAGPRPPNPQELLGQPMFERLLAFAAGEFEVVIVDTPAAARYSDAENVASLTRGALLVTRRNQTRNQAMSQVLERLNRANISCVGAVLNSG